MQECFAFYENSKIYVSDLRHRLKIDLGNGHRLLIIFFNISPLTKHRSRRCCKHDGKKEIYSAVNQSASVTDRSSTMR